MLKTLLINNLYALKSVFFRDNKNKGKAQRSQKSRILIGVLFGLLYVYMGVSVGFLFFGLGSALTDFEYEWLYFSFAFTAATMICFISGIFTVYTQLFESKDNDLLLSMPIPPRYILAGRTFMVLMLNYIFESLILIPAFVVYCLFWNVSIGIVITFIVEFLLLPLPVIALSYVVGFIINAIASRMRNKSIMITVISVAFLLAYMYYMPQLENFIAYLQTNASEVAGVFESFLLPAYHFSTAICNGNIYSLFMYFVYAIVPFAVVYAFMSFKFISIITTRKSFSKIAYSDRPVKQQSIKKALVMRELKHFVSIPVYMVNNALGIVFTVAMPIFIIIKYNDFMEIAEALIAEIMPGANVNSLMSCLCIVMLCLLCTTDTVSAPSISLEGNTMWLLHSLPIKGFDVLMSKIYAHVIICLPFSLIAGTVFNLVFPSNIFIVIMMYITPTVMTILQAFVGLWANMKFPRTDFINETAAVKQSLSVLIAMFGGMAFVTLPAVLYIAVLRPYFSYEIYILLFTVLSALLSLIIYLYMRKKGNTVFDDIT